MKSSKYSLMLSVSMFILSVSGSFGQAALQVRSEATSVKASALSEASRNAIMRHLTAFSNNDLEAVVSDYTEESVLVTPSATYTGIAQIRGFFADLLEYFPKPHSNFNLDKLVINDGLIYIIWHAKTPKLEVSMATDTFVIKDGKILQQTYAGQMKFIK